MTGGVICVESEDCDELSHMVELRDLYVKLNCSHTFKLLVFSMKDCSVAVFQHQEPTGAESGSFVIFIP